jgi:hypothetical protein
MLAGASVVTASGDYKRVGNDKLTYGGMVALRGRKKRERETIRETETERERQRERERARARERERGREKSMRQKEDIRTNLQPVSHLLSPS